MDALLALDAMTDDENQSRVALSERTCAREVAKWNVGQEGDAPRPSARHPGFAAMNWLKTTKWGARAGTIAGRAATLRTKYRHASGPKEAAWRFAMARCFMLAIRAREPEAAKVAVLQRAQMIGESDFAQQVLIPMIDAKFA